MQAARDGRVAQGELGVSIAYSSIFRERQRDESDEASKTSLNASTSASYRSVLDTIGMAIGGQGINWEPLGR